MILSYRQRTESLGGERVVEISLDDFKTVFPLDARTLRNLDHMRRNGYITPGLSVERVTILEPEEPKDVRAPSS